MRTFYFLALLAVLCLGFGALVSCGGDDDDDSSGDDDAGDDDDGGNGDDDDNATGDTWTDPSSGLTWQDPPFEDYMTWEEAIAYCENLDFDGHDDWRLPTISELRSLIRGCDATVTGGSCGVTDGCTDSDCRNDQCGGCEYLEGPGSDGAYWPDGMSGEITWYWSSSPVADDGYGAWCVRFGYGSVYASGVDYDYLARCVRP